MNHRQIMDAQARQLFATASVIAEAKSQKLEGKTSHGKAEAVGPQSAGVSVYDELLRILSTPLSEAKLEAGEKLVRDAKVQRKVTPRPERQMIIEEWEDHKLADVVRITGVSKSTVKRWREEAGRDPVWGRKRAA